MSLGSCALVTLRRTFVSGLILLQLLTLCVADEVKEAESKAVAAAVGERQIYSPRMGKDISSDGSETVAKHLFERIPPLPKLGKTFDTYLNQYRREDDDDEAAIADEWRREEAAAEEEAEEDNEAIGGEDKRAVSMLRMGKRAGVSMLRMGKRFDEDSDDAEAAADEFERNQRAVSMLRMGRSGSDDKRAVSMLRMGRSGAAEAEDKRAVSMLRMGRSDADEKRAVSMLRMG